MTTQVIRATTVTGLVTALRGLTRRTKSTAASASRSAAASRRLCAATNPPLQDGEVVMPGSAWLTLPPRLEVLDAFPLSPIGKLSERDLVARFS